MPAPARRGREDNPLTPTTVHDLTGSACDNDPHPRKEYQVCGSMPPRDHRKGIIHHTTCLPASSACVFYQSLGPGTSEAGCCHCYCQRSHTASDGSDKFGTYTTYTMHTQENATSMENGRMTMPYSVITPLPATCH